MSDDPTTARLRERLQRDLSPEAIDRAAQMLGEVFADIKGIDDPRIAGHVQIKSTKASRRGKSTEQEGQ